MCGGKNFGEVINLGSHSLVNSFIKKEDLNKKESLFPIVLKQCKICSLVQMSEIIDPEDIYRNVDYLYFSSDVPGLTDYYKEYVKDIEKRFLKKNNFVLEIASNDGILLNLLKKDTKILGVDPATNVTLRALKKNVSTVSDFFTESLAQKISREWGAANVIIANSVMTHANHMDSIMRGVSLLLDKNGVFVLEDSYWGKMVEQANYYLIYHDHYCYLTLKVLAEYAPKFGMRVFDAFIAPSQGSCSIRAFFCKDKRPATKRMSGLKEWEEKNLINDYKTSLAYRQKVIEAATRLRQMLESLKKQGKKIAGYGASAKGGTIARCSNIGKDLIDYYVDDSPAKQGLYTPIYHIPIISRQEAEKNMPDYFLIFAANYAQSIIAREQKFLKNGGHFIIPHGADIQIV